MYERVLLAIDHSEVSKRALTAAAGLAALSDGEVWVLHLREREVIPRMGLVADESPDEAPAKIQRQDVTCDVRWKQHDSNDGFYPLTECSAAHWACGRGDNHKRASKM